MFGIVVSMIAVSSVTATSSSSILHAFSATGRGLSMSNLWRGSISTLQARVHVQFNFTVSPVSVNAFSVTTDLGATDAMEFDVPVIAV